MTGINNALNTIRELEGKTIGNGQCYALSAYYENLITPNSTVGLGAGVNSVSGAIGDTISAHNIGTAYNWTKNGWTVLIPQSAADICVGCIINIKPFYGNPFNTGVYGHTAVVTAIDNDYITLHEQNYAGKQYVVQNVYVLNQAFLDGISSLVCPPETPSDRSTKRVNGDLFSSLITDVDPNIMNGDYNRLPIKYIVIHHNAETSDEAARRTWYVSTGVGTSAHYQVTPDKIWGCVSEESVAYHAGDYGMNQCSIGIEHLNETGAPSWTIAEATYQNSARLIADICQRYNIPIDHKHIIPHKAVSATACPGGIDIDKLIKMAQEVAISKNATTTPTISKTERATPFKIRVSVADLNIRKSPSLNASKHGFIPKGVYTITETKQADGYEWGKLKSGTGWIALDFTKRL